MENHNSFWVWLFRMKRVMFVKIVDSYRPRDCQRSPPHLLVCDGETGDRPVVWYRNFCRHALGLFWFDLIRFSISACRRSKCQSTRRSLIVIACHGIFILPAAITSCQISWSSASCANKRPLWATPILIFFLNSNKLSNSFGSLIRSQKPLATLSRLLFIPNTQVEIWIFPPQNNLKEKNKFPVTSPDVSPSNLKK